MTGTTARRVGAGVTLALMVAFVVPAVVLPIRRHELLGLFPPDLGAAVTFAIVGAFLLVRARVTNIAVIMCVQGVTAAVTTATGVWRQLGAESGPLHGGALWAAWVNSFSWLPGVALLTPLVLLFPNGRLSSPKWRWPIRLNAAFTFVIVAVGLPTKVGLVDGKPESFAPNPTGLFNVPRAVLDGVSVVTFFSLILLMFISLGALIGRRRHASGVERAQLTCLLYGGALAVALIATLSSAPEDAWWTFTLELFAVAPVAAAIGVAVLRYRLFEIDRLVSRTVAYSLVLAILAAIYIGVVVLVSRLIPSSYGHAGVAVATLLVSILAAPLTRRVRHLVDRRFNRSRFDAERVIATFAAGLRARPERDDIPADLVDVVRRTVAPAHAGVWLLDTRAARR